MTIFVLSGGSKSSITGSGKHYAPALLDLAKPTAAAIVAGPEFSEAKTA